MPTVNNIAQERSWLRWNFQPINPQRAVVRAAPMLILAAESHIGDMPSNPSLMAVNALPQINPKAVIIIQLFNVIWG